VIVKSTKESFESAVALLRSGRLVALPTETVYGLAADSRNDDAVQRIYDAKNRPSLNPLIAHIFDAKDACQYVEVNDLAKTLIKAFWPGPLTLVLPKISDDLSDVAGAHLDTLAIRCPKAKWADAFLRLNYRGPIYMPSANRSGHVSPTRARHVADDLNDKVDLIIDAGPCSNGIESTVLKIENDHAVLLRPGAIPIDDFIPYISDLRLPKKTARITAPGMLESHYAPKAEVRLNAIKRKPDEAFLAFGPTTINADYNLSPKGDLQEAARNLYAALRTLDQKPVIAIAPIPMSGIGMAINDRLRRAAADKGE